MKVRRALAYPLAIGTAVPLQGRVKECADLIAPGNSILDIGCSSGWLGPDALKKGFNTYVGLDRVIIGAEPAGHGVSFIEGSVFELPFGEGSFDAACLFDVIEHLPRGTESRALREVCRVLSDGGKLYFSTPHASVLHTPLDPVWCLGHRHYRRQTVSRMLLESGFRVERMFVAGGIIEGLDHLRLLVYKHLFRRPLPNMALIKGLIERSHGRDKRLGMTVFAVASRVPPSPESDVSTITKGATRDSTDIDSVVKNA